MPEDKKDFEIYYNCGISYLRLSNLELRSKRDSNYNLFNNNNNNNNFNFNNNNNNDNNNNKNDVHTLQLLTRACSHFEEAILINPNSPNALHNLAVNYAKIARLLKENDHRKEIYQKSYLTYQKAYSFDPSNIELLFDWGNALYRNATSMSSSPSLLLLPLILLLILPLALLLFLLLILSLLLILLLLFLLLLIPLQILLLILLIII